MEGGGGVGLVDREVEGMMYRSGRVGHCWAITVSRHLSVDHFLLSRQSSNDITTGQPPAD